VKVYQTHRITFIKIVYRIIKITQIITDV